MFVPQKHILFFEEISPRRICQRILVYCEGTWRLRWGQSHRNGRNPFKNKKSCDAHWYDSDGANIFCGTTVRSLRRNAYCGVSQRPDELLKPRFITQHNLTDVFLASSSLLSLQSLRVHIHFIAYWHSYMNCRVQSYLRRSQEVMESIDSCQYTCNSIQIQIFVTRRSLCTVFL